MKIWSRASLTAVLLVCGGVLHAMDPYGLLNEAVEDTTSTVYAADFLLDKRPIRYAVSDKITPAESKLFAQSVKKWPKEVARLIEQSGHADEFQDVLPILKRGITVAEVAANEEPDVYLDAYATSSKDTCSKHALACFRAKGEKEAYAEILVYDLARDNGLEALLLHEIGHYYGLSDQYASARKNSHAEYSSNANQKEGAIMNNADKITCDDADGFINLLDLFRSKRNNGRFPERSEKGWTSLCGSTPNTYREARTVNRSDDALYDDSEKSRQYITRQYKEGYLSREISARFTPNNDYLRGITISDYKEGKLTREVHFSADSPLQIFSVTPQDEVTYDPKTNLISQIDTRLLGHVSFPKPKSSSELHAYVYWTRRFFYDRTVGVGRVGVSVDEWFDGVIVNTRDITLSFNGDFPKDPNLHFDGKRMLIKHGNEEITLTLQNREITEFTIEDKITKWLVVTGVPNQNYLVSMDGGKSFKRYKWGKGDTWSEYTANAEYLPSFYKNFFDPLFPPKQEPFGRSGQIASDIQKGLWGGK